MTGTNELPARTPVPRVPCPDPDDFARQFVDTCQPVVVSGAVEGWPAMHRWTPGWLSEQFGDRVVPVSCGPVTSGTTVEMTLGDFLTGRQRARPAGQLYLRQLRLPGVLPELMADFSTPPYCPPERPVITNLWLGPEDTVQPFHKDNQNPFAPVHNLLVQVRGRKLVSLVSPDHDAGMYPRPAGQPLANYSQVDYLRPDFVRFPHFRDVEVQEAVIGPGEIAFIPAGAWHHVRSLEPSISLNFWWHRTRLASVVALLAGSGPSASVHLSQWIGGDDVQEFGGIWPLALVARTLPADAIRRLLATCTPEVEAALGSALDELGRQAAAPRA
jgi:cupin-like protein